MLINKLPKSLIECATNILTTKKTPIAFVSFKDTSPLEENMSYVNEELSGDIKDWIEEQENKPNALRHLQLDHEHTDDDKTHVYRYTALSRPLNKSLQDAYKSGKTISHLDIKTPSHNFTHDIRGIDAALHRNKLAVPLVTYSGIGWHPNNKMDEKGEIYLPAYTSTTTSKSTAFNFARANSHQKNNPMHILRIQNKAGDPGFYTKDDPVVTHYEGEREYIIPRNTKIRINKNPTTFVDSKTGLPVHVWDAERISSEPADTNYKAPYGQVELYNKDGLKLYQTNTLEAYKIHYPDDARIDEGASFHESHIKGPVLHIHQPNRSPIRVKSPSDIDKYPQLKEFKTLMRKKPSEDDYWPD